MSKSPGKVYTSLGLLSYGYGIMKLIRDLSVKSDNLADVEVKSCCAAYRAIA